MVKGSIPEGTVDATSNLWSWLIMICVHISDLYVLALCMCSFLSSFLVCARGSLAHYKSYDVPIQAFLSPKNKQTNKNKKQKQNKNKIKNKRKATISQK